MNSGAWITFYLFVSVLVIFPAWEFIQLYRRRHGAGSALTMSQYITKRVRAGSKPWLFVAVAFPIFILLVSFLLLFHWEGLCYWLGIACELSRNV